MKIVNRAQFMAMPSGILFQNYHPCIAGSLAIRWQTMGTDFVIQSVDAVSALQADDSHQLIDRLDEMQTKGASYPIDFDCAGRDGCFDRDQLFIVWEADDVRALIKVLSGLVVPHA